MRILSGFAVACGLAIGAMASEPSPVTPMTPAAAIVAPPPTEPRADSELVRAVRERRVVKFIYDGRERAGEPHAYGVAATGEPLLLFFQTGGDSATRPPPGWRRFSAAKIERLVVTDAVFTGVRAGFSREDPKLVPLWAAVE